MVLRGFLRYGGSLVVLAVFAVLMCTVAGCAGKVKAARQRRLTTACSLGTAKEIEDLLKLDPSLVNGQPEDDLLPMYSAAEYGNTATVKVLLKYGAKVNVLDPILKRTPLGWAEEEGHLDVMRCLIKAGADVSMPKGRDAPLHLALIAHQFAAAKLLV